MPGNYPGQREERRTPSCLADAGGGNGGAVRWPAPRPLWRCCPCASLHPMAQLLGPGSRPHWQLNHEAAMVHGQEIGGRGRAEVQF
jgi:hypothetical protein